MAMESEQTLNHLTRLSQKPGVQSTLVLSRENGAIVRTSGLISNNSSANPNSVPAPGDTTAEGYTNGAPGVQSAEDVARLVWNFVSAAGTMVEGMDGKDGEVKLLRVRTRKNELVIVPGMISKRRHSKRG